MSQRIHVHSSASHRAVVFRRSSAVMARVRFVFGKLPGAEALASENSLSLATEGISAGFCISLDELWAEGPSEVRYAMSASISCGEASMVGIPPAFIFGLGLCRSAARRSLGNL